MHTVSSTSALVLLWTDRSLYESDSAKRFFQNIKLDSGILFKEEMDIVFVRAKEEVSNRKYGVKKLCTDFLKNSSNAQVVFLGPGLDPLSLELAHTFPRSSFFDVDMDNMGVKEAITREIDGPENIAFCKADIGNPDQLVPSLEESGWDKDKKTLLVAEGVAYYIPKEQFQRSLGSLRTAGGGLVFEYSVVEEEITDSAVAKSYRDAFDKLQELLDFPCPLNRYAKGEISSLAKFLEGELMLTMNQTILERGRTGSNQYYKGDPGLMHLSFIQFLTLVA